MASLFKILNQSKASGVAKAFPAVHLEEKFEEEN